MKPGTLVRISKGTNSASYWAEKYGILLPERAIPNFSRVRTFHNRHPHRNGLMHIDIWVEDECVEAVWS